MPSFTFDCVVEISADDEQEAKKFLFKFLDSYKFHENIINAYSNVNEFCDEDEEDLYHHAIGEFNLPNYENINYKLFVIDMHNKEITLQHYNGRNFYSGPAVVVKNIQDALSNTKIKCQWDTMGKYYVVYPKGE